MNNAVLSRKRSGASQSVRACLTDVAQRRTRYGHSSFARGFAAVGGWLAVASMAFTAFAAGTTHVWTNASSANPKFSVGENWQSTKAPDITSKAAKDPASTAFVDTIDFSQVSLAAEAKPQTIVLPSSSGYLLFGTLLSNPYQVLNVDYSQNGASKSGSDVIWVYNTSDFKGIITCNPAGGTGAHNLQTMVALFKGTTLPIADGRHAMAYYTRYQYSATIGQFAGAGLVTLGSPDYIGQGTTTIQYPSGPETSFNNRCGVYVLNGYTTEAGLVEGSVLHFDASDLSTITVSNGKVLSWRDKSGAGIVATTCPQVTLAAPCENPGAYAPSDVSVVGDSQNGLQVVSFGAPFGNRTGYRGLMDLPGVGQPGALKLSSAVTGVKEVFFVFRDVVCKGHQRYKTAPFVIGTESGHAGLNPFGRLVADQLFTDDIFASTGPSAMMKTSAVFCDGQRVIPETSYVFNDYSRQLHVVSCGLSDGTGTIETLGLGCDASGNIFYGGVAIAEVIAYNRTLTAEERHQVNGYLRAKWQPEAGTAWDYGSLWVNTIGSCTGSFQVASGVTAIRDLRPIKNTFDKEGAGTLVIGRLHGFDDYVINVKGGDVRFETPALPVEERAADPLVWFDATQISPDKILHSNDVDYVTEIVDPRPEGRNHHGMVVKAIRHSQVVNQTGKLGAYATLQANALNGKAVFNFGEYYAKKAQEGWGWETTKSSAAPHQLTLDGGVYNANMREGFAVVRIRPNSDTDVVDIFGGNYDIFGGTRKAIVNATYTSSMSRSGLWRVNGEIVEPTAFVRDNEHFYLVSVSLPRPLTCNTLAIDRNAYTAGGMDVAELIIYDRQLSDGERVNTEAYLMKKWLNAEHPYSKPVKVRVNASVDPERLIQGGKGELDISSVPVDKLTGVEVNGGSLKWNFSGADLFLKSKVHLDATVGSSLTTTGGNWVTSWSDVRGNGVAALADMGTSAVAADISIIRPGVSPTVTTATLGGVSRNVIDFGDFTNGKTKDASGMRITASGAPATSSAMRINIGNSAADKGLEFYVVHADAHTEGCTSYNGIMGIQEKSGPYTAPDGTAITGTGNDYPFLRDGRKINNTAFSKAIYRGGIYVDGVKSSSAYSIAQDNEFHLYSFYPEVPVLARGLAMRMTYERGGQKLGEVAIFTTANSPVTRDRINAYLMRKWLGTGTGLVLSLKDITLTDGGVFDFATDDQTSVSVQSIVGDGTVKASALAVTDLLTFKVLADGKGKGTGVTSLIVDGELTLPVSGRVVLEVPSGLRRIGGKFPLVTATTLKGGLSGLELVVQGTLPVQPQLLLEGGVVYIDFPKKGVVIFVR